MEEMSLKVPVAIKAKLTESLRVKLRFDLNEDLKKIDLELQQLDFRARRMIDEQTKIDSRALPDLHAHLNIERRKREDFKKDTQERLEVLEKLELGSELNQGTLDRIVTVKIGDDLNKYAGAEILLEDGKIIAFRM